MAVGRFDVPRRTDNLPHPVAAIEYRQNTISTVESLVMQRVIDLQSGVVLFSAIVFSSLASDGSGHDRNGRPVDELSGISI